MHRAAISPAVTVLTLTCAFASPALAGDALTIRDLAPDNAVLVVGADDVRGTIDRLGPTAFGKLWNDPALAEDVKKLRDELEKGMNDAAKEAGIERSDMSWPSSLGLAVMVGLDEELGLPSVQYVFFCDWSAEAEKAQKFCDALVERMQKEAKDSGEEMKSDEVRGRRVFIAEEPEAKDGDEGADADEDDEEDGFGMGMPDIAPKSFCITSDKGRIFAASSKETMDMLLGRVDGDHAKAVGESATFKGAVELAGGTQDVYAVLSTEAAQPMLAMVPQLMLGQPIIDRLFGNIKAWSFGAHAKDGVFEVATGAYVPDGKVGLLSLLDSSTEPKPAPAIVPSDALSYGRMNVRFDKVVSMLDEAIGGMPPEFGEMIKPQLDMYRPAMTAAFSALGPEVHIWSSEPDAADPMSGATVTAIAMKNDKESAAAVSDFINLLPLGLQSRDFNGMTIMSDEFAPAAVGMGGGYLVIGNVKAVERTLRAVDAKGEAGLAGDKQYAAAFSAMPKEPVVGMAWFNLARQFESTAKMMQMMTEQLEGMAEADGEDIPGLGVGMDDVDGFYDLLKPDVVKRCFGDGQLAFRSTKDGFSTVWRMMPGAPAAK